MDNTIDAKDLVLSRYKEIAETFKDDPVKFTETIKGNWKLHEQFQDNFLTLPSLN